MQRVIAPPSVPPTLGSPPAEIVAPRAPGGAWRRVPHLLLALLLGLALTADAVVGIFTRASCTSIPSPTAGSTWCFDSTANALKLWDGTTWVSVVGGQALPSYPLASLPPAGTAGRLARVTDDVRGLATDLGDQWLLENLARGVPVHWFGAKGDGTTDDSTAFQSAINAAQTLGTAVIIPPVSVRYLIATGLTADVTKGPLAILGHAKYSSVMRYSGTGSWLAPTGGNANLQVHLQGFTLQMTGAGAIGVNMQQFISSTVRSVRFSWNGAGTDGTGLRANITNTLWNSFFNVIDDVTFDALATGISIDASVAQRANRWRIVSPTFIDGTNGIIATNVQGIQIIAPTFSELTGTGITLGASADRTLIVAPSFESSVGGTLFSINAAANRTTIVAPQIHAGASGLSAIGVRGVLFGEWGDGHKFSGSTLTTLETFLRDGDGSQKLSNADITANLDVRVRLRVPAGSPAQITADQNDYNPSPMASFLRLSSDAARTITGLEGGTDGQLVTIINVGAFNILFADQSVSSTAANRVITGTGATVTVTPDDMVQLLYDNTTQRWRMIAAR